MRWFFAALLLVVSASAADAQRHSRAIAQKGDLALSVGFNGLDTFSISPLEGGVGIRYWAGTRTVIATSLSIGGEDTTTESVDIAPINGGEITSSFAQTQEAQTASLAVWVEQHVGRRRSAVSPFVGVSLRLGNENTELTRESVIECRNVPQCQEREEATVRDVETVSIGGGLRLGAEVKIVNGVTLSGAYSLGATYQDRKTRESIEQIFDGETVFEDDDLSTTSGWQFGVGTTRVALSVYF